MRESADRGGAKLLFSINKILRTDFFIAAHKEIRILILRKLWIAELAVAMLTGRYYSEHICITYTNLAMHQVLTCGYICSMARRPGNNRSRVAHSVRSTRQTASSANRIGV